MDLPTGSSTIEPDGVCRGGSKAPTPTRVRKVVYNNVNPPLSIGASRQLLQSKGPPLLRASSSCWYTKEKHIMKAHDNYVSFLSGFLAGIAQAGVFNPYDRALYLSIKNKVPFLTKENFRRPYQGFLQTVGGRAISGGLYFPLEHMFKSLVPADAGAVSNFMAGTAAGAANGLMLNPISAVRYKTWGRDVNRGMMNEAKSMYRKGGIRPFCKGLNPTLTRDVVFGGSYTFLRLQAHDLGLPQEYQWVANFCAAAVATVVSGPFNLARNIQYGTKTKADAPSVGMILQKLTQDVSLKPTFTEKVWCAQKRLRIGWGTARVAVGMAFANHVYDYCMTQFERGT